jgi:LysM domain
MTAPLPRVLRQYAQPTTKGGAKAEQKAKEAGLPKAKNTAAQEIGFFAHTITGATKNFTVLAGAGAPTVIGGWPKIAQVARYGRVAITVPEGWGPIEMTVPILFDATLRTQDRPNVEVEIAELEWMAGRRPTVAPEEIVGEPPYVTIYTTNAAGTIQTNLVPRQYQTVQGRSQQWFITDIAFDTNPERDTGGERTRQAATVTLLEIISSPSALARNRSAREEVKNKYETVRSTAAADTIKKIALKKGIPASWSAILKANPNLGTDAEKRLRPGTKVKIPLTAYRQVPR